MVNTSANVRVGKPDIAGGVYSGATTVTLPTTATGALGTGIASLGYVNDEGLTQTIASDTNNIVAWGGDTVRTVRTSHDVSYQLTFIETSDAVLKEVFGTGNVSTTSAVTKVSINSVELPRRVFVFQIKDGLSTIRIVVPNGQITEVGDVVYNDSDPIGYQVTISAYPDTSGNKAYHYIDPAPV